MCLKLKKCCLSVPIANGKLIVGFIQRKCYIFSKQFLQNDKIFFKWDKVITTGMYTVILINKVMLLMLVCLI